MDSRAQGIVIAVACISFVGSIAVANVCPAKQDQTLDPRTSGAKVVEAAVQKIEESDGIFPDDNQFLRRIAYVESKDGTDASTYRAGYYGGIWQVDELGFQDTQNTNSHHDLAEKFAEIQAMFGIDWTKVTWRDLEKPFYSALAARLLLSNSNKTIPSSSEIQKQAEYWKTYYNTENGTGTEQKFVTDVMALNQLTSKGWCILLAYLYVVIKLYTQNVYVIPIVTNVYACASEKKQRGTCMMALNVCDSYPLIISRSPVHECLHVRKAWR